MSGEELPRVELLKAVAVGPDHRAARELIYPNLSEALEAQRPFYNERFRCIEEATDDIDRERARSAAVKLIMMECTAEAVDDPARRQFLTDIFTNLSREQYGAPDPRLARSALSARYREIAGYKNHGLTVNGEEVTRLREGIAGEVDWLLGRYSDLGITGEFDSDEEELHSEEVWQASQIIAEAAKVEFGDTLAVFDGSDEELFDGKGIVALFERAREVMGTTIDTRWGEVNIELVDDDKIEEAESKWLVTVGRERKENLSNIRGLFGHVFLWHLLQYYNGNRLAHGDANIKRGLPGYYAAAEGGAKLIEFGLSGRMPTERLDRYGDIALALGEGTSRPLARPELFLLASARDIIRLHVGLTGQDLSEGTTKLQGKAWKKQKKAVDKVNRVFRGTPGDFYTFGANTNDVAYLERQISVAREVNERLSQGHAPLQIFRDLTQFRHDPTNPSHRDYLERHRRQLD